MTTFRFVGVARAALLLVVLGSAPAAWAQEDGEPPVFLRQTPTTCAPGDAACPTLNLDTFLDRVLAAHPDVRALRLEDERAIAALTRARGGFDPLLVSGYEYKTQQDKAKIDLLQTGLSLPFDVLTSPLFTLDYKRGLGSSINPEASTSFDGETRFGLALSPLQGLRTNKTRASLAKARLDPRLADAVQVAGRNRILLDATEAFWKWVETAQQLQINRDLLALALRRRAIVAQQVRIGEAPAIDSVEVALSVASRRSKVADAIRKAEQAGIKLAVFMWTDGGGAMDFRYRPPALPDAPNLSEEDAFDGQEIALDRRPEIQQVRVKLAQTRVEQRLARERLRPKLLLEAQAVSYEANPLDVSDFKLGVKIDQPLLFRGGRGDVEQTQVDVLQLDFKREITERKVLADVDAALVALRQAEARVDIAERRVELAGLLQEAEQRRFELGESTLFLVNQRESSFAQAREELVAARADALRAFAQYRWATGTISASPYDL